jgi:phospholipase/carboxylesterase
VRAIERQGSTLTYLAIEPDDYDTDAQYPVVVLLHGFGAHMGDLAGLTPAIDPKGYVYICPNAPIQVQLGPGMVGYAWTQPGGAGGPEEAEAAEAMLDALFDEVTEAYRVEPGNLVLGGFSQGCMMSYRVGLPSPQKFRGVLALSGRVTDPSGLRSRLPDKRDQPIFVAHGSRDAVVSVESAREAISFLEAEGYAPEYHEYPMGHEIAQRTINDAAEWIRRVLPPLNTQ